jgi:hypothetical protein
MGIQMASKELVQHLDIAFIALIAVHIGKSMSKCRNILTLGLMCVEAEG